MSQTQAEVQIYPSEYKAYTTKFDQVKTAIEILREKGTSFPDQFYEQNKSSEENISNARLFAENYRNKMLEKHGYIPAITLLVDNSGSLKGEPASYLKTLLLETSRIFEEFKIPFEVIGYTTAEWKGGKSREKWIKNGKPNNPGRLNDLLHIVYKSFDDNLGDIEKGFDILCSEKLLKENIDGEALRWAHSRKPKNTGIRHIVQLYDGIPCDDSTIQANGSNILVIDLLETLIGIKDNETRVHGVYIDKGKDGEKDEKLEISGFYNTYSSVRVGNDPIGEFFNNFFSKLTKDTLDDIKDRKRKEVLEILGLKEGAIGNDDILKICGMIDLGILKLLKEFGLSGIDILLNVNTPLKDINQSLFKINLSIVKSSGRIFGAELGKLLPYLVNLQYHEILQNILRETSDIDNIILILKNVSKFIKITSGKTWQKDFLDKYLVHLADDSFNLEIFGFLIKGGHIKDSDIDNLGYILINGNFETIKILLESGVKLDEIISNGEIISFNNTKKLSGNLDLLKKGIKNIKDTLEKINFCMLVNTEMLDLAISFGITDFNDLKSLKNSLSKEYSESSIEDLFRAIFTNKEKKRLTGGTLIKSISAVLLGLAGYSEFNETTKLGVISWGFSILLLDSIVNGFTGLNKNIEKNTNTAIFLFKAFKNFTDIIDQDNHTKENSKELEDYYDDIMNEKDEKIFKMLGIDKKKIKVQYFIYKLFVILKNIPDFSYITDKDIAEEALGYLKEILEVGPMYLHYTGYNYKFFLKLKSKLETKFGYEQTDLSGKIIDKKEYKDACKVLGVGENASLKEVKARRLKLAKEHHTDVGGEHDKMAEINNARDTIFAFRGWN